MTVAMTIRDRSLVALTPAELPAVQAELAEWCKLKVLELSRELADARQNLRQAKKMKWRHGPWERVAKRTVQRMIYYCKIRAAVKAGYLVVPNFPMEVLAVRVGADSNPKYKSAMYPSSINEAKTELLPPGQGKYVDEMLPTSDDSFVTLPSDKHPQGQHIRRHHVGRDTGFDDQPDFPVTAIKPVIMQATERAMILKIFDRIGVAFGGHATSSAARRKSDPIVMGEIIDASDKYRDRRVTFFIAWWLDTKSL